jgi:hypothetical protein
MRAQAAMVMLLSILAEMLVFTAAKFRILPLDVLSAAAVLTLLPFCVCAGLMIEIPSPARIIRTLGKVLKLLDRRGKNIP